MSKLCTWSLEIYPKQKHVLCMALWLFLSLPSLVVGVWELRSLIPEWRRFHQALTDKSLIANHLVQLLTARFFLLFFFFFFFFWGGGVRLKLLRFITQSLEFEKLYHVGLKISSLECNVIYHSASACTEFCPSKCLELFFLSFYITPSVSVSMRLMRPRGSLQLPVCVWLLGSPSQKNALNNTHVWAFFNFGAKLCYLIIAP